MNRKNLTRLLKVMDVIVRVFTVLACIFAVVGLVGVALMFNTSL